MSGSCLRGVIAAAATPVRVDNTIDHAMLITHCARLMKTGCDGINLLGTTGEATSFSVEQRLGAMRAVAESGLPVDRFMVGTGAAALADATRLTAAARDYGFAGALLLPPFYYKGIDDDGLLTYVDTVIDDVDPRGLRLYLYNFPQLSGVQYTPELVERLQGRHPEQVLGLKDSSGDLEYSAGLARKLPSFAIFPSAEGALERAEERGFAGCISATVNITAMLVGHAWRARGSQEAANALGQATAIREVLVRFPLVAAIKWAIGELTCDSAWACVMPPLRRLSASEQRSLRFALAKTKFAQLGTSTGMATLSPVSS